MRICFVLPKFTRQPIGGYKIVFEYANRLQKLGNQVVILFLNEDALKQFPLPSKLRVWIANYITNIEPKWFSLDKKIIKLSSLQKKYEEKLNDIDVCFATGIQTVEVVRKNFLNVQKFYFIQGYENWYYTDEYVKQTYNYGFKNIVISNWLKEIVDRYSNTPSYILKNPIDIEIYKMMNPQERRTDHTIGLLYHTEPYKGVGYAMEAIRRIKSQYPDLQVYMFGMFPKPRNLPAWIHYKQGAKQEDTVEIYNKVQVFLCASIEEGYGLTGLEAMACGACLVSTAYRGVSEYAKDNYNALLSPVKDIDALVANVLYLFDNPSERKRISDNGIESVKDYSWEKAINSLCKMMGDRYDQTCKSM
jgi:glycosyltransferase involved in cell wall biosynthesis